MSISLVAVFFPILLLGGIVGKHLPRIRRDPDHRHRHVADRVAHRHADDVRLSRLHASTRTQNRLMRWSRRVFEASLDFYRRTLGWSLDNPKTIMFILLVAVVLNVYLLAHRAQGLLPRRR